jgi:dephospho-CoA kinase
MIRVGLTGGIACGKSVVADELRRLGAAVIDADQLARRVVEPGNPAFEEVVARFGPSVVAADGRIDRAALARIVFSDPGARAALEEITHPKIVAEAEREAGHLAARGERIVVFEAALLIESGLERDFDALVVVTASPETQVARLGAREGLDVTAARHRLAAQMPTEEKVRRADHVIRNDGTIADLRGAVRALYETLAEHAGQ